MSQGKRDKMQGLLGISSLFTMCLINSMIHIDYYTVFLIPALIPARVDRISLSPKGEG